MVVLVIALIIFVIEAIYFKLALDIVNKSNDGMVFVHIWFDSRKTSGWVKRSTFYSCVNGKKADYDIITLEKNGCSETFIYGDIKQMKEVRKVIAIVLGSL